MVDACSPPDRHDCGLVSLDSLFDSSDAVWVGVQIDGSEELSPRQLIGAVPFAVQAASADEARVARHALTADSATTLEGFDPADYATLDSLSTVATTGAFTDLVGVPDGLGDGDDDTLGVLVCADGESPVFNEAADGWVCGAADPFIGLDCADGESLIFDEAEGAFVCLDPFDKDRDGTLVWEDCDDNDALLNHLNVDGDPFSTCDGDCNDGDPAIHPGTVEICGNDVDENCDDVIGAAGECWETYTGGGQTIYRLGPIDLPAGDAARWYQDLCEAEGLRPVSCDYTIWTSGYDARDFNAVVLDAGHYSCNVSTGVTGRTGWIDVLTFHRPYHDAQGVCQNGCTIDGDPVYPICTDPP
jgi:hypothetical protein